MSTPPTPNPGAPANERLLKGWLQHKTNGNRDWTPFWCVLHRDGNLYFFSTPETSYETLYGNLRLTKDSTFHNGVGNIREGFRFELNINRKRMKFRVQNSYGRELWRAYMQAVITGRVPQDVILSPQDMQVVQAKFQPLSNTPAAPSSSPSSSAPIPMPTAIPPIKGHTHPNYTPDNVPYSDLSPQELDSSLPRMQQKGPSPPSLDSRETGSSWDGRLDPPYLPGGVKFDLDKDSPNSSEIGSIGSPFMIHKFDTEANNTPPWFFEDCSRELAEHVLKKCPGKGNTLMRVSTSSHLHGSYVISTKLKSFSLPGKLLPLTALAGGCCALVA